MKLKWLWGVLPLMAVVAVAICTLKSSPQPKVSARFVGQQRDANSQVHILYEITNANRYPIYISLGGMEAYHERTGWWPVSWQTTWNIRTNAGSAFLTQGVLYRNSVATIDICRGHFEAEGSAFRGKIWQQKVESRRIEKLRALGYRALLPRALLMAPKPKYVELPQTSLPPIPMYKQVPGGSQTVIPSAQTPRLTRAVEVPEAPTPTISESPPTTSAPPAAAAIIAPAGSIKFQQAELRVVLDIYAEIANATLEIDSPVRSMQIPITMENSQPLTRAAALTMFEQALQRQAGITMERLDGQHVKVRCPGTVQDINK